MIKESFMNDKKISNFLNSIFVMLKFIIVLEIEFKKLVQINFIND